MENVSIPFERLVTETTEGITVCDARGADMPLVWVNRGFLALTGYAESEIIGRNCRFLQGPETSAAELEQLRAAIRSGQPTVVELINYRKDGRQFYNSLSLSPVMGADGNPDFYIGVQTDVTDRRLRRQLEQRFVDNVAHELKTPLTALSLLLETLDRPLNEIVRQDLIKRMSSQTQRLISMVEQLMTLNALDAELQIPPITFDLREMVLDTVELVQPVAEARGVSLRIELPSQPVPFHGQAQSLSAMLANLLDNAVKYTPSGGGVSLNLTWSDEAVILEVADTGIGIPAEHQARIFERFYRVHDDRARKTGGAGIGLALVAEAVRQAQGSIAVESQVGQGSVFRIRLPRGKLS